MFLCYTSQGVVTTVKWSISLVVTSNHKCLNKIVSNKLALIIFKSRTQPQRWLPKCRPYDGGIRLLNLFLICLRNGRFWWENSQISQNALALTANTPNQRGEILEILHLTKHETQFSAPSRANGKISQNAMALIANEPN